MNSLYLPAFSRIINHGVSVSCFPVKTIFSFSLVRHTNYYKAMTILRFIMVISLSVPFCRDGIANVCVCTVHIHNAVDAMVGIL